MSNKGVIRFLLNLADVRLAEEYLIIWLCNRHRFKHAWFWIWRM